MRSRCWLPTRGTLLAGETPRIGTRDTLTTEIESVASRTPRPSALECLSIGLYGSVLGVTGLSVARHLAHDRDSPPRLTSNGFGRAAVAAFVLVTAGYAVKSVIAPGAVRVGFSHPIAGNPFGTVLAMLLGRWRRLAVCRPFRVPTAAH